VQTSLENLSPLPFTSVNLQLAFMKQGLAMGAIQSVLMTPVGLLMGCANLAGQMSGELFTGFAPAEGHQVLLGAHVWGLPGCYGGCKSIVEWQRAVTTADGDVEKLGSITLACTRPHAAFTGVPSVSISAVEKVNANDSLVAGFERAPSGKHTLSVGGSRQLEAGDACNMKLKGLFTSEGVLGLALELSGAKSSATLSVEARQSAAPKFGACVQLAP